jgi:hypothetical protein
MNPTGDVIQSKFVNALRTQAKTDYPLTGTLTCPYSSGCQGRIFQNLEQLYNHAKTDHSRQIEGLDPNQARDQLKNAVWQQR